MEEGVVKSWNPAKGNGFISRAGRVDLYVDFRAIISEGETSLKEGDKVRFKVVVGSKGFEAKDVEKIN